ncbi:MAG: ABC transporter ATP-binding protein [Acidobacteriota bacterium]
MSTSATVPPIEVDQVSICFGRRAVLDDVSLTVPSGEVYALLGRNGAGKSTLLSCLAGLRRPGQGRLRLLGRDSFRDREHLMHEVAVVPEEPDAPPAMSANELGVFCRAFYTQWDEGGYHQRVERFAIDPNTPFGKLSRGQKAQVMLALALAPRPSVLLLDDPTLGLDAVARQALYEEVIGELADRGVTVLITSHDVAGIEAIATRIGILHHGVLEVDEPIETLKARFRRLRWQGEIPTRILESHELAPLAPSRRALGEEVIVTQWHEQAAMPDAAHIDAMALEEILVAVSGHVDNSGSLPCT